MDRFIAFMWDADRPDLMHQVSRWFTEIKARAQSWTPIFEVDGLLVLALPDISGALPVCALSPDAGVVIGTIFANDKAGQASLRTLATDAIQRVRAGMGEDLIGSYWGSFIGILQDTDAGLTHVVRDPCGATACYYRGAKGVTLLCSFPDDIADLSGMRWSIDWGAVQAFLVSNYFINPRTGLRELAELMPGCRMTFRRAALVEVGAVWNPVAIAQRPQQQSFEDACAEFRTVAEDCVSSWSQGGGTTLIRLSGGLDSSVVAGLFSRTGNQAMLGLHFVGRGYDAYEFQLARKVAERLDIELVEERLDEKPLDFRSAAEGPRLPRPTKQLLGTDADRKLQAVCESAKVRTIASGHGGDAIFLQRSIASDVLVDQLIARRAARNLARVAYDTAALLETSVWHVMGQAVLKAAGRQRWDKDAPVRDGLARASRDFSSEAFRDLPGSVLASMWLEAAPVLPPGKAEQLRSILALRNYHAMRGHAIARQSIHPLISQPLVELALATPTYLFNAGGTDRAIERTAFADLLPQEVLRRYRKGFVNHSVSASIVQDLIYMRDLVLNGQCMDAGLLDRAKVERLFSLDCLLEGKSLGAAMDLIAVESWLTAWSRRDP